MKISGICLTASQSLNGEIFTIESLQNALKGQEFIYVSVFQDHDYRKLIGSAKLWYDQEKFAILYEGEIDSNKEWKGVSVGIIVNEYELSESGVMLIKDFTIYELSVTDEPAMPYVSITAESVMKILNSLKSSMQNKDMAEDLTKLEKVDQLQEIRKALEQYSITRRAEFIIKKEAITASGISSGNIMPRLFPIPSKLIANTEEFLRRGVINGRDAKFLTASTPIYIDFGDTGNNINDSSQTITTLTKTIKLLGYKQTVTELAKLSTEIDLVEELIRVASRMGPHAIDLEVYNEIEGSGASVIYGGGKSSEGALTSSDVLTTTEILKIHNQLMNNGWSGEVLMLVSPKQFTDLLNDQKVYSLDISGNKIAGAEERITEITVYGIRIRPFSDLVTGTGSGGITTYHAAVFAVGAVGAVWDDVRVEINRDPNKVADVIAVYKPVAAKVLSNTGVLRVITA